MKSTLKRIGILTGGGDCPGLNAVIRSIAKPAMAQFGCAVIGILDVFEGLIEGRMRESTPRDVGGHKENSDIWSVCVEPKLLPFRSKKQSSNFAPCRSIHNISNLLGQ
jgi:6-phosphofructokinase